MKSTWWPAMKCNFMCVIIIISIQYMKYDGSLVNIQQLMSGIKSGGSWSKQSGGGRVWCKWS